MAGSEVAAHIAPAFTAIAAIATQCPAIHVGLNGVSIIMQ
jgi:hypothetical protein